MRRRRIVHALFAVSLVISHPLVDRLGYETGL